MAHKKGVGSSRNGRDSNPKFRGVKKFGGEKVIAGNIIIRQCGTKVHPGKGVGIGTDFTQGYGQEFFDWITHDKGYARKLTDFGDVINPEGIRTIGEFPNLTAAMERRGWKEARIRKVIGENWVRVLKDVWGA